MSSGLLLGVGPIVKPREAIVAEVVRRYTAGESIRQVAAGVHRSYGFVQGVLKQAEVPRRRPGAVTADVPVARQAAMAAHPSAGQR